MLYFIVTVLVLSQFTQKFKFSPRVLLDKITIVGDNPSARSSSLQPSASIKERSKVRTVSFAPTQHG